MLAAVIVSLFGTLALDGAPPPPPASLIVGDSPPPPDFGSGESPNAPPPSPTPESPPPAPLLPPSPDLPPGWIVQNIDVVIQEVFYLPDGKTALDSTAITERLAHYNNMIAGHIPGAQVISQNTASTSRRRLVTLELDDPSMATCRDQVAELGGGSLVVHQLTIRVAGQIQVNQLKAALTTLGISVIDAVGDILMLCAEPEVVTETDNILQAPSAPTLRPSAGASADAAGLAAVAARVAAAAESAAAAVGSACPLPAARPQRCADREQQRRHLRNQWRRVTYSVGSFEYIFFIDFNHPWPCLIRRAPARSPTPSA